MNAVVGTLLLAAAFVLLAWARLAYRRPNPSTWTTKELPAEGIAVGLVGLLAAGVGTLASSFTSQYAQPFGIMEAAMVAAIVVVTWLVVRALHARLRGLDVSEPAAAETQSTVATLPLSPPAQGSGPGRPPVGASGRGGRPGRRKAA